MEYRSSIQLLTFTTLWCLSSSSPAPQFYPLPFPPPSYNPQDSSFSGSHTWQQTLRKNFTNPNFLDPLSAPAAEEILKNNLPRQTYLPPGPGYGGGPPPNVGYNGLPPNFGGGQPQNFGFPQIYRVDNLVIIANPTPQQPQPCIPQRPPPNFPNPRPSTTPGQTGSEDGLDNRFGEEPSKCTWAIVACCSPDNVNVRYNCFELLGCPGFFFDNSPCDPKTVMAAANAALEFYTKGA